ncbi:MAG TPA: YciI family protein [Anaerolineales bacterium]
MSVAMMGRFVPLRPAFLVDVALGQSSYQYQGYSFVLFNPEKSKMRYFMSIIPPADLKPEDVPQGLMDAMGPWMEKSLADGSLISTGGLKPASEGKRLVGQTGGITITDGPFAEAKEVIGGYAVFEAPDPGAATALAREFLQLHLDNGLSNIILELREIAGGANY